MNLNISMCEMEIMCRYLAQVLVALDIVCLLGGMTHKECIHSISGSEINKGIKLLISN